MNDNGELGVACDELKTPTLVNFPHMIEHIACGYYHTAIITSKLSKTILFLSIIEKLKQ